MSARTVPVAIFTLAVLVRFAAAQLLGDQSALLTDAKAFQDSATNLLHTGLLGDPYRMPLYPLLIVVTGGGKGQLAADILISACATVLIYALTLELFRDKWGAAFAGFGAALYPPFVFFSVVGLSETLFLTLVLAAFYSWYREQFVAAAIASVLAILTRPAFDLAALFFVIYFSLVMNRLSLVKAVQNVIFYGCIYVVLMTPWWIHNYKSYGTFVRFNLAFGVVLYAGNNPMNKSGGGNLGEDYEETVFSDIADPVARDRAFRGAAIRYMVENPRRVFELAGLKFIRIWRVWPHFEGYSDLAYTLGLIVSFAPICFFALLYLINRGRRELLLISPLLLFIGYYTAVHMLLLGTIRFRLPFEPYLLMFAAMGFVGVVHRWAPTLLSGDHNATNAKV